MKDLLKRLFVPALASRPVSALATRIIGSGIPVFMVHRVSPGGHTRGITPDHLRRCLGYLVDSGYNFVSLEDVVLSLRNGTPLPDKPVAFTIDDGFTDQAQIAAPIFLEFNCPVTFFVITDMLNQNLWPWDAKISWIIDASTSPSLHIEIDDETLDLPLGDIKQRCHARHIIRDILKEMDAALIPETLERLARAARVTVPDRPPPEFEGIDWEMARKLEHQGIRFAPHSQSHRILSKLDRDSAQQEILGSWTTIEKELTNPLKVFCYPTGRILDFGPREIGLLKDSGFLGAISTIPGFVAKEMNTDKHLYSLPRFELPESMEDFIQYCTWIEYSKEHRWY